MQLEDLYPWYLADPDARCNIGELKLVSAGKGVSLHYVKDWLANGFALSEDLPLIDNQALPPGRLAADASRAVGAVSDARPHRCGAKVIRFVVKPKRLSWMEYLYYAGGDRLNPQPCMTIRGYSSPLSRPRIRRWIMIVRAQYRRKRHYEY